MFAGTLAARRIRAANINRLVKGADKRYRRNEGEQYQY
jgi:hypothetical protein